MLTYFTGMNNSFHVKNLRISLSTVSKRVITIPARVANMIVGIFKLIARLKSSGGKLVPRKSLGVC